MTSLVSLAFLAAAQAPPQESAFRYPLHELTLDNGLRVLIVERRDVPRVYGSLWWRVGSVHERPGATGLSHFFEHMMFMGTKTIGTTDAARDAELNAKIEAVMEKIRALKLDRLEAARRGEEAKAGVELDRLEKEYKDLVEEQKKITIPEHLSKIFQANGGTGLNATTSYDRTNYFVELPSNKIELFCWLESDRFLRPVFRSFYSEREVVKEERRMRTDSTPTGLVQEAYWSMFWQAHPYTWPVIGWMSDIDQYTLTDAEEYYRTHYTPENCTVIFVGDVDVPALQDLCRRYFGRLKPSSRPRDPLVTVEPPQVAERRLHGEADAQDEINVRWHGPSGVHKDSAAVDLLMAVLSGRSGRLYRPLVEEKRLALETEAWYWSLRHGGVIHVGAMPREGADPEAVERELLALVEEVREKGVTDRELLKARNQQLADLLRGMRTNAGIAQQLGYFETIGTYKDLFAYLKALETATAKDLQRVAHQYLRPEGRNVLVLRRRAAK
ncbi:MAG TPA: pitrilysin family protein [Planctomycetota bacterium]|nr:pitrilysin family protein [Planctomycetota bacterium]